MADESRPVLSDFDSFLFHQGTDYSAYKKLGANPGNAEGVDGTWFNVWAPNAKQVYVVTAATRWENMIPMHRAEFDPTVWEVFVANVHDGDAYRYVVDGADGIRRYKSDPFGFRSELRPDSASIVSRLDTYTWHDADFLAQQDNTKVLNQPIAIYEVHLGSWKKKYRGDWDFSGFMNYRELADELSEYVNWMGFTHVELIGICEHPFDGSWGYQVTGFFSPTSRYGTPDDFRYFVDKMHQCGIAVILDWVPAHFPKDPFGLESFDGTPLFESGDPLRAEYPQWGTKAFDHGKPEVRSFLISSAFYWVREFHIDALRVDAVAAMLYASFGRAEWRPNMYGGDINLESKAFLQQANYAICGQTNAYMIAEDSSELQGITGDVRWDGIGFTFKWNMGWMNDSLRYLEVDPIFRKWHHNTLTHTADYAFNENYILVLSHDEVVHLKHSMVEKAPGDKPARLGGLKSFYTYQFTHPGKKLLFMGQEFAQEREWSEARSSLQAISVIATCCSASATCWTSIASIRACIPIRRIRPRSSGSTAATRIATSSASSAAIRGTTTAQCWSCAASPRIPTSITRSAFPSPVSINARSARSTACPAAAARPTASRFPRFRQPRLSATATRIA